MKSFKQNTAGAPAKEHIAILNAFSKMGFGTFEAEVENGYIDPSTIRYGWKFETNHPKWNPPAYKGGGELSEQQKKFVRALTTYNARVKVVATIHNGMPANIDIYSDKAASELSAS